MLERFQQRLQFVFSSDAIFTKSLSFKLRKKHPPTHTHTYTHFVNPSDPLADGLKEGNRRSLHFLLVFVTECTIGKVEATPFWIGSQFKPLKMKF